MVDHKPISLDLRCIESEENLEGRQSKQAVLNALLSRLQIYYKISDVRSGLKNFFGNYCFFFFLRFGEAEKPCI